MISDTERAQWFKHLRGMVSSPGEEVIQAGGKDYARTLAKACPHCEETFWTYQVLGQERQPYKQDPIPKPGSLVQARETCGHPLCWDKEQEIAFQRVRAAREAAHQKVQGHVPQETVPPPKLVRNRQNQTLKPLKDLKP